MNANFTKVSIPLLRWTLGLVVMLQSFEFVFSTSAAHFLAKEGLPAWLRPVLGGAEIIAAALFLAPFTAADRRLSFAAHLWAGGSCTYLAWSVWGRRTACLRDGGARLYGLHGEQNSRNKL